MKLSQLLAIMMFTISCGQQGSFSTSHDSKVSYKLPDNPPSRTAAKPIDSKKEANDYPPPKSASQKTETVIGIVVSLGITGLILWEVAKAHGEINTAFKDYQTVRDEQLEIRENIRQERDASLRYHQDLRQKMQEKHDANMKVWTTESAKLRQEIEKAQAEGRDKDVRNLMSKLGNLMNEIKNG